MCTLSELRRIFAEAFIASESGFFTASEPTRCSDATVSTTITDGLLLLHIIHTIRIIIIPGFRLPWHLHALRAGRVQNPRVTRYLIDEEEANMEPKVAILRDAAHLLGTTTFPRAASAAVFGD
jgi:hypothetical protein